MKRKNREDTGYKMSTADDYVVKIRGNFLQIGQKLFNPEHIVRVVSEPIYQCGKNGTYHDSAAVQIVCRSGKYPKEDVWLFGIVMSYLDNKAETVSTKDPQADLHQREADKLFEHICLAMEMLAVGK